MTDAHVPTVPTAPRPHPSRLVAANYPVFGTAETRYADMDVNGHLNNLALESMHENARAVLNARLVPGVYDPVSRGIRLVSASNIVQFLREAHWPDTIRWGVAVGRLGRTSFVSSTALFVAETCISLCDTVLVAVDGDGPTPLEGPVRRRLEAALWSA